MQQQCAGHRHRLSTGLPPDQLKGPPAGRPNVLVLGSPHLSSLPETFTPAMLEPLLQRLEAWYHRDRSGEPVRPAV